MGALVLGALETTLLLNDKTVSLPAEATLLLLPCLRVAVFSKNMHADVACHTLRWALEIEAMVATKRLCHV